MKSSNEAIGKILKFFRIANDFSTRDLGTQMQISHSYISMIESGKRKISHDTLHTFAKFYNMGAYQIMDIVRYYEELECDEVEKYQFCLLKVLEAITNKCKTTEKKVAKIDKNLTP